MGPKLPDAAAGKIRQAAANMSKTIITAFIFPTFNATELIKDSLQFQPFYFALWIAFIFSQAMFMKRVPGLFPI